MKRLIGFGLLCFVAGESKQSIELIEEAFAKLPIPENHSLLGLKHLDNKEYEVQLRQLWDQRQAELIEAYAQIAKEENMMKNLMLSLLESETDSGDCEVNSESECSPRYLQELSNFEKIISIEDFVQDFDKAKEFVQLGGVEMAQTLLKSYKNESKNAKEIDGLYYLIGTACKYNEDCQTKVRNTGLLYELTTVLKDEFISSQKFMYALGSVVRGSKENAEVFYVLKGLELLLDQLDKHILKERISFKEYDYSTPEKMINLLVDIKDGEHNSENLALFFKKSKNTARFKALADIAGSCGYRGCGRLHLGLLKLLV
eukprot:snap_masked-scaffold_7-processed-gene-18.27-mRNA-1 protein AED:1.00 eAED:1.00 QI:0/-1/0/0/-1/1/1/0/314